MITDEKLKEYIDAAEARYKAQYEKASNAYMDHGEKIWQRIDKTEDSFDSAFDELNELYWKQVDLFNKLLSERESTQEKLQNVIERKARAAALLDTLSKQFNGNVPDKNKADAEDLVKTCDDAIKMYESIIGSYEKNLHELRDAIDKLRTLKTQLTDEKYSRVKEIMRKEEARAKVLQKKMDAAFSAAQSLDRKNADARALLRAYDKLAKRHSQANIWTTMPIKTPGGKTFTVMDDLVRQLIKEGFKKIFLMQCNPGKHQLAKDIRDTPGVTIRHSRTTALVENVIFDPDDTEEKEIPDVLETDSDMLIDETYGPDPFDRSLEILEETSRDLEAVCESYGFTERFLNECSSLEVIEQGVISEGTISNIWEKLKEFVKKAIAFVVSIFRKIVEFFKKLITKIKDFFRKIFSSDKVSKDAFGAPVTHAAFSVSGSSASLNKISAKDWEAMRKITQEGCETISKEIDRLEKEQLKNMKDLEQYSAKQAQTVSESASPSMDRLIALML